MSMILVREPEIKQGQHAGELMPGTWFVGFEGGIFGVMIDDRTNEKRIVSIGDFSRPFIAANPVHNFKVDHILPCGSVLQITDTFEDGGHHGHE